MRVVGLLLLVACLLAGGATMAASPSAPAGAGMVLDLQGAGEVSAKGERRKLKLLDYLQAGEQLTLAAGSKASLSHYAAKQIYRLNGPVQVEVKADAIAYVSGTPLQASAIAEKTVTAALHPNLGPAAIKMRAVPQIVVRAPANGGTVLGTRPEFRWEANENGSYTVDLLELPGKSVAQVTVTASTWTPPPALALSYGKSYRWTVTTTSASDGKPRSAAATFSVLAKSDADLLAELAPGPDSGVDELVLYATILKDWNLVDEAAAVWRRIAALRPDLDHAR